MNSKFQRSHINDSEMTKLLLERLITNTVHELRFQEGLNKLTSTRIWIGLSCCRVDSAELSPTKKKFRNITLTNNDETITTYLTIKPGLTPHSIPNPSQVSPFQRPADTFKNGVFRPLTVLARQELMRRDHL